MSDNIKLPPLPKQDGTLTTTGDRCIGTASVWREASMRDYARAAVALNAPGWLPIATAPKYTEVLVWRKDAVAFFGHWWNLESRQQIIERVGAVRQAQAGHDRPVYIYDIIARSTVDELVIARHKSKRTVQDLLLEAMRKGTSNV